MLPLRHRRPAITQTRGAFLQLRTDRSTRHGHFHKHIRHGARRRRTRTHLDVGKRHGAAGEPRVIISVGAVHGVGEEAALRLVAPRVESEVQRHGSARLGPPADVIELEPHERLDQRALAVRLVADHHHGRRRRRPAPSPAPAARCTPRRAAPAPPHPPPVRAAPASPLGWVFEGFWIVVAWGKEASLTGAAGRQCGKERGGPALSQSFSFDYPFFHNIS
jgi:hypothetical protein